MKKARPKKTGLSTMIMGGNHRNISVGAGASSVTAADSFLPAPDLGKTLSGKAIRQIWQIVACQIAALTKKPGLCWFRQEQSDFQMFITFLHTFSTGLALSMLSVFLRQCRVIVC
jgi:hypothetical protein